tara:strand:+ start:4616 stop:5638 length:1023 start_codon:yes stop_codon:yes gene_type:complete
MTVYAVGNTPADFLADINQVGSSAVGVGTGSGTTVSSTNQGGAYFSIVSGNGGFTFDFSQPASEFWMTFWHKSSDQTSPNIPIYWYGPLGATFHYAVTSTNLADFKMYDGTTWVTLFNFNNLSSQGSRIDFKIKIDAVVGEIEVYTNNVLSGSFYGNTLPSGDRTTIDRARLETYRNNGVLKYCYWSQILVQSDDTRTVEVLQTQPNLASFYQEQDTGAVTDINLLSAKNNADTDVILFTNPDARSTFTTTELPAEYDTGWFVTSVVTTVRAANTLDSPIQAVAPMIRTATGVDAFGANSGTELSFNTTFAEFPLNPDTGLAWTIVETETVSVGARTALI